MSHKLEHNKLREHTHTHSSIHIQLINDKRAGYQGDLGKKEKCKNLQTAINSIVAALIYKYLFIIYYIFDWNDPLWLEWPLSCFFARKIWCKTKSKDK